MSDRKLILFVCEVNLYVVAEFVLNTIHGIFTSNFVKNS